MKSNRIRRALAHTLTVASLVAVGVVTAAAQGHMGHAGSPQQQQQTGHTGHSQSGDMPYDLHYIDMTMMHHDQGMEMARLAEGKGSARVKAFAAKTAAEQEKDKRQLQWHRDNHYSGRPTMNHAQMMEHMKSMPMAGGMKMDPEADMAKLRAATGREFDRLFLDTMTHHHQMAVDMSKEASTKAGHAGVREFARQTVTKQQAEIAEMKRIKAALGGGGKAPAKTAARKPTAKKKPAAKKPAAPAGHTGHH